MERDDDHRKVRKNRATLGCCIVCVSWTEIRVGTVRKIVTGAHACTSG
jgi:hypothetical protein